MKKYEKQQAIIDKGKKTFIEILKLGNEGYPLHLVLDNIGEEEILKSVKEYVDQFDSAEIF